MAEYYNPVGETSVAVIATEVTGNTDTFEDGGWYVVKGEVDCGTITVNGSANLILADGAKLTVNGDDKHAGIEVTEGNTLTIWGQENGAGELVAIGRGGGAGIGGGKDGAGGTVTLGENVVVFEGAVGNGSDSVKIGSSTGGSISWNSSMRAWVIKPDAGVKEMKIAGFPEEKKIEYVLLHNCFVPSGVFMGFGEDAKTYSLALNPEGEVNVVKVTPTIGEIAVDENGATLKFKTIAGLFYDLLRSVDGGEFEKIDGLGGVGTGEVMTLKDSTLSSPQGAVLYTIVVSRPIIQPGGLTSLWRRFE